MKRSATIERKLDEIKKLQRAHDRARELMTRVKGVETGLSGVESQLDKIVRESEYATAHLQSADRRIDKQEKDFIKIKQEVADFRRLCVGFPLPVALAPIVGLQDDK